MIFDTHAHYDDPQFDPDREALLGQMEAGGVGTIVNASASVESWERVLELTRKYPFVYGMIGVHPDEVGGLTKRSRRWERSGWTTTGIRKSTTCRRSGLCGSSR